MNKKKKTLGDVILMNKGGFGDLLDQAAKLRAGKIAWDKCNVCGDPYLEVDLTDDEEVGLICKSCTEAKRNLDQEQEDIETIMREEKKMKAGVN